MKSMKTKKVLNIGLKAELGKVQKTNDGKTYAKWNVYHQGERTRGVRPICPEGVWWGEMKDSGGRK